MQAGATRGMEEGRRGKRESGVGVRHESPVAPINMINLAPRSFEPIHFYLPSPDITAQPRALKLLLRMRFAIRNSYSSDTATRRSRRINDF